jgi:hypothetical protein
MVIRSLLLILVLLCVQDALARHYLAEHRWRLFKVSYFYMTGFENVPINAAILILEKSW